ncbi:murein transglycosylase [Litchfieldella qijiaojingensis]|uniref:Murein transglycosylase n=1 Tax=Litchfieldella qijiaojingensis TaxID=980347 RepID=A0ABQ2YZA3_9GAMM|nr:lytic murein transglycosylase [Halomonas qijiaojingensis]GGY00279.1 murein transglycosylase [Halomonas qijiaojingensis]
MRKILIPSLLLMALAGCQATPEGSRPAAAKVTPQAHETTPSPATASAAVDDSQVVVRPASFAAWVTDFRARARAEGIDEATLAAAFDRVSYQPRVIELDRSQPEFVRPIWEYLDIAVSSTRIDQGRAKLSEHGDTAREMERRYGVPREIVTAIWGIESNYGSNFGSFSTIDALATLGYDGRRPDFARNELMSALRILERGDISRERMQGSWAGAMGHTQFLPSSFERHAVDGDGDGRRDIWGSIPDVMASTANYLAEAGWRSGQPWGGEVVLPDGFDYSRTELSTHLSSQEWASQGVRPLAGGALPNFDSASVIAPAGAQGPAFLVGPNYRAILRYNNATSYALAVGTLADGIAGRGTVAQSWPRHEQPLSRSQVREMQQRLNAQGFDTGTPDGVMGPNTRRGLREYQRSIDHIPDGFATRRLLERLQSEQS